MSVVDSPPVPVPVPVSLVDSPRSDDNTAGTAGADVVPAASRIHSLPSAAGGSSPVTSVCAFRSTTFLFVRSCVDPPIEVDLTPMSPPCSPRRSPT